MAFDPARLGAALHELANAGVFVGTSSWKYRGWSGLLYDESRYVFRGRFALSRFEEHCLTEYGRVFQTVCVDAAYYTFPTEKQVAALAAQVPADFRFAFKVTDAITVKRFGNLARFGARAGQPNPQFLDAGLFTTAFLGPLELIRPKVGPILFEFSRFRAPDYAAGREFVADLDGFLGRLPRGWRYGVEIRNRHFLHADYFACLARHGVAHVFNHWADMPGVGDQWTLPHSRTADFVAARFLLKPGRKYEDAVRLFSPYLEIKEPDPEARAAGARLIREGRAAGPRKPSFIYVNNRLEGNALLTIQAMVEASGAS